MPKKIIWSSLSEEDFSGIIRYLNKEWNTRVAKRFIDIIEEILEQISLNPKQFPLINKKREVRKCVITILKKKKIVFLPLYFAGAFTRFGISSIFYS